jgi:hypothetical protein
MTAKISPKRRRFQIRQKRKRKEKIKKHKEKYKLAKTQEEKEKILEKLRKIAPHYSLEQFLK